MAEIGAADGLAPLDVERFWADDERAQRDPWAADCPQTPLGIRMSNECVWAELNAPEEWFRLLHDDDFRVALERRYNDLAQKIVGRRLLGEKRPDSRRVWPATKGLADLFEARNIWQDWSYWLQAAASTPDELKALLERVERRLDRPREFLLPPNWDEEKTRLRALGVPPPRYRGQRGPVTFAMSVYGVENLIFLMMDQPELALRFRDTILRAILTIARVLDEEAGDTSATAPKGWWWADDNCAMLNAEMYETFAYPILKGVFDRYAPGSGDIRYQHSDSDMGHLLPLLGKLGLTGCNFGPRLTVTEIREQLPRALIHGQLAPFSFSRNDHVRIVAECLRDIEMAQEKRGLILATAGSVNNGSRLASLRLIMSTIQRYGRY